MDGKSDPLIAAAVEAVDETLPELLPQSIIGRSVAEEPFLYLEASASKTATLTLTKRGESLIIFHVENGTIQRGPGVTDAMLADYARSNPEYAIYALTLRLSERLEALESGHSQDDTGPDGAA